MTNSSRTIVFGALAVQLSFSRVRPLLKLAMLLWLAVWGLQLPALGQGTYTWKGGSTSWNTAGNWSGPTPGVVPGKDCTDCDAAVQNLPSGNYPSQDYSPLTLNNLTIGANSSVQMNNGDTMTLNGSALSGDFRMDNTLGATTVLNIGGSLTFTNAIFGLSMENNSQILGGGTLMNQGTITYGANAGSPPGVIGNGSLTLQNLSGGAIISGSTGKVLNLCPNANWLNNGVIEAEDGAILTINCTGTITQTGGQISANNSTVTMGGPTITGGTLASPNGGTINTASASGTTLNNVTNNASYQNSGPGSNTALVGTITNNGSILLQTSSGTGRLFINGAVTLQGSGVVYLNNGLNNGSKGSLSGDFTLTNKQTISGQGIIDVDGLNNQGTIQASAFDTDETLTIEPASGALTNTGGTIRSADSSATVEISGVTVNNAGGTISSFDGSAVLDGAATISGGTIQGLTNYVEGKLVTLDGTSSPVTIGGTFEILGGDKTTLKGTFNGGPGEIEVNGCPNSAVLHASGTVVINSGLEILLANDCSLNSFQGDGKTATKVTINGSLVGNGVVSAMSLIIGSKGTLTGGPDAGTPLVLDPTTNLTNHGKVIVDANSTLQILGGFSNFISITDTLSGGNLDIFGILEFENADIVTNAGIIILTYPGQITDQNGHNALAKFSSNKGSFTVAGGQNLTTAGAFTNTGKFTVQAGNTVTIGGSGNSYTQTGSAAVTKIDGELSVPAGGSIDIAGGTLEGAGTLNGSVSVGNAAAGAAATFIIGDDTKHAGSVSVTQNYTQLATGIMDVQIGGTSPGSKYSQLNVTGPVKLSGTLNIKRINNFKPLVGQQFTIVNAPSGITGTFSIVNGLSINTTEHFTITYESNAVVLTVASGP